MTAKLGRADLHIHTLASDGTAGIVEILDHVERSTDLDVIAITDHERIDAARRRPGDLPRPRPPGPRSSSARRSRRAAATCWASSSPSAVKPLQSLRSTIAAIHDQGGLAIPAHPLVPYPLCAQGWVLRRLIADPDPRFRPDALEAFNPTTLGRPWHGRVVRFAAEQGLPTVGNSDAHAAAAIGTGWTTFPGHDADDLRQAIVEGRTHHHGSFHGTGGAARDVRAAAPEVRPRRARHRARQDPPRRHRARPGLPRRPSPAAALRGGPRRRTSRRSA